MLAKQRAEAGPSDAGLEAGSGRSSALRIARTVKTACVSARRAWSSNYLLTPDLTAFGPRALLSSRVLSRSTLLRVRSPAPRLASQTSSFRPGREEVSRDQDYRGRECQVDLGSFLYAPSVRSLSSIETLLVNSQGCVPAISVQSLPLPKEKRFRLLNERAEENR